MTNETKSEARERIRKYDEEKIIKQRETNTRLRKEAEDAQTAQRTQPQKVEAEPREPPPVVAPVQKKQPGGIQGYAGGPVIPDN
jgi:cell division protein FtsN